MLDDLNREFFFAMTVYHKMKVAKHQYKIAKWERAIVESYGPLPTPADTTQEKEVV